MPVRESVWMEVTYECHDDAVPQWADQCVSRAAGLCRGTGGGADVVGAISAGLHAGDDRVDHSAGNDDRPADPELHDDEPASIERMDRATVQHVHDGDGTVVQRAAR